MINNCNVQFRLQQFLNMVVLKEMTIPTGVLLKLRIVLSSCLFLVVIFVTVLIVLVVFAILTGVIWRGQAETIYYIHQVSATFKHKKETTSSDASQGHFFSAISVRIIASDYRQSFAVTFFPPHSSLPEKGGYFNCSDGDLSLDLLKPLCL